MKYGPYFPYRRQLAIAMEFAGLRPGDILIRLGAAIVYGFVNFSSIIAAATESRYSHAAMVLSVEPEVLIADVSDEGLRRQFFQDWVIHVHSDDFLVLRHKDDAVAVKAVEIGQRIVREDPGYDDLFVKGWDALYCVELVCLAYEEAGANLCKEVPMNQLPGWQGWWMAPAAKLHRIDASTPIWFVGNDKQGILACNDLTLHRRMKLSDFAMSGHADPFFGHGLSP